MLRAQARLAANVEEYNTAISIYRDAKKELDAQQAMPPPPSVAPADDSGGAAPEAPPEEPMDGMAGLFSGAGEPKWLPLGKLGTPLALISAWFAWEKLKRRRRR